MGMAASQARLIELTARKSNVEYEGQQINQQRVNLANESAGMFTELMNLQVPIAPKTSDYTSTVYGFSDGAHEYTITNVSNNAASAQYNATVTFYHEETNYRGMFKERSDLEMVQKTDSSGTYWYYGTTKLTPYDETKDKSALEQIKADMAGRTDVSVVNEYNAGRTSNIYSYKSGGQVYYVSITDAAASSAHQPIKNCYAADVKEKVSETKQAYIQKEDSGRYSSITLEGYSDSFPLTSKTETDQNAYNDAINEYNYQQNVYQQKVNEINAKTEKIQQEDRTLEMKLKQLDTEQDALSTEMDAVKKVIDKNVESTFKTFS